MKSKTMKSKIHAIRKICSLTFVGSVVALLVTQGANADTITWKADATSTSWALDSNWIGGVAPVAGDDVVVFGRNAEGTFAPSDATGYETVELNSLTFTDGPDGPVELLLIDSILQIGAGGLNKISTANLFLRGLTLSSDQTWEGIGPTIIDGEITGSKLNADTELIRFDNNSPWWDGGLDVRQSVGMGNNDIFSGGATDTPFGTGTITLINQRNDGATESTPTLLVSGRSDNIDSSTAQTIANNIVLSNLGEVAGGDFIIRQGWDTALNAQRRYELSGVISGDASGKRLIFDNAPGEPTPAWFILSGNNTYTSDVTAIESNVTLQVGNGGTTGTLGTGTVIINGTGGVLAFNRSDNLSVGNEITGGGEVQQIGNGTTTLTADNDYSGETTVFSGTLGFAGGSQASVVTVKHNAFVQFTLGSPTTSSSSVTLDPGAKIKISGAPVSPTDYTLITASGGISGTPVLAGEISGYRLVLESNNTVLKLKFTDGAKPGTVR